MWTHTYVRTPTSFGVSEIRESFFFFFIFYFSFLVGFSLEARRIEPATIPEQRKAVSEQYPGSITTASDPHLASY